MTKKKTEEDWTQGSCQQSWHLWHWEGIWGGGGMWVLIFTWSILRHPCPWLFSSDPAVSSHLSHRKKKGVWLDALMLFFHHSVTTLLPKSNHNPSTLECFQSKHLRRRMLAVTDSFVSFWVFYLRFKFLLNTGSQKQLSPWQTRKKSTSSFPFFFPPSFPLSSPFFSLPPCLTSSAQSSPFSRCFFFSNLSYRRLSFSPFLTSEASSFLTFILYYDLLCHKKKKKKKERKKEGSPIEALELFNLSAAAGSNGESEMNDLSLSWHPNRLLSFTFFFLQNG